MPDTDSLFEPFEHARITLKNRVVMAPMTRNKAPGGVVNQAMIDYYCRRAEGGVGLIITEGICVDHVAATGFPDVPFIGRNDTAAGWQELVARIHERDCKVSAQLWHVGAMRKPGIDPGGDTPGYSPSGVVKPGGKPVCHVMSESDIADTIASFARSARQAREAGFDAVEIHGAHGYLVDQFFWSGTNQRDDAWGGSLQQRTRFACELAKAIRREVGEDMLLGIRVSQWKQQDFEAKLCSNPDELEQFLQPMVDAGIDIFHCSTRRFWEPEFEGSELNFAGWVKKLSGMPAISVGSIGLDSDFVAAASGRGDATARVTGIDRLLERMSRGEFDLAAVGRALIANPDWANKVRDNRGDDLRVFEREMLAELH